MSNTIKRFIKSVMDKDYSDAQECLEVIVNEKIVQTTAEHLKDLKETR